MHLSGLIIRTGQEKENSQTSKNIHKTKIDVTYQFSLRKHSAKAVSSGFSEVHPEDGYLDTCNVVHWGEEGAVEIWLFVHQDYSGTLAAKLRGVVRKMREAGDDVSAWLDGCGYPLHHKNLMVTPAFLRSASISFQMECQPSGTLVYVRNGVYHQVLNTGVLLAEAVNMGSSCWNAVPYQPHCGCSSIAIQPIFRNPTSGEITRSRRLALVLR